MQSENPSRLERARRFGGASGRGLSAPTPSVQLAIGEHLLRRKLGQCSISLERQAAALEDFAVRLPYNADDFYLPLNLPAAPCARFRCVFDLPLSRISQRSFANLVRSTPTSFAVVELHLIVEPALL